MAGDKLLLLDECIQHLDGAALKAALIYVENSISGGSTAWAAIPFPVGSKAWCFTILILYKPWRSLYNQDQQPLLLPHQSAKDALIENGMVCATCLALGGGLTEIASIDVPLRRCANCQFCWYCSEKCQRQHWKSEHKDRCNNKHCDSLFVVGDDEERNFRGFLVQEMHASQQYIQKHPFPEYKNMFLLYQFLLLQRKEELLEAKMDSIGGIKSIYSRMISAYTRGVHDQLESVYQSLGTNSFEAKAIALGEYLHQVGGVEFMEIIYEIMVHQFGSKMHERNKEDKIDPEAATGAVGKTALSQLGSSWDYIESWEERRRTKEKSKMEIKEEEEEEEAEEEFGSYYKEESIGVCAAE